MNTNLSIKIGITSFVFLALLFLISCSDTSSTSTPSVNSAPKQISNTGNVSGTNTQVQPIKQANDNIAVHAVPVQSSETISYEDLISMINDAPNHIAVEEKIKDYFGEQSVLVKDVPVIHVTRNDAGRLFVQGGSIETGAIATVFYVEEKDKQSVTSLKAPGNFLEESDKVNIRCTYDEVGQDKDHKVILRFNFSNRVMQ